MIKFEFIVDDADAENILECIRESALRNDERIMCLLALNYPGPETDRFLEAYKQNKEYLLGLIEKMKNTKV